MPDKLSLPGPWAEFLSELDQNLSGAVELHCLGGFVLTALHGVPRPTGDIDYIEVIPSSASAEIEQLAGRDSKLAKKYRVYLQNAGGIPELPENYHERLIDLPFGFKSLTLKALEPYDLVLSKLRNSPKDREDIKYLAGKLKLDFRKLIERYENELKSWIPNSSRHDTTLNVVWREYFSN